MIPKGQYPTGLKTVLKAGPGIIVMCGFGLVFCTTLHGILFHPHERVERFYFRSNRFERQARKRDDKLRYYYESMMNWDPNTELTFGNTRPLLRY